MTASRRPSRRPRPGVECLELRSVPALILQPAVPYLTGDGPQGAAAGDVDGDGRVDLVTVDTKGQSISVLLGVGDGTFRPRIGTSVGVDPVGISAADFDGDDRLDLAIGFYSGGVGVLLGRGDGTFTPAPALVADGGPTGLVAADFNGDGRPDLAAGQQGGDLIRVWSGAGDGTFAAPAEYRAGFSTFDLKAVDVDGDAKLDLVAAEALGAVAVLRNDGGGHFGAAAIYPAGAGTTSVVAGDWDGDGFVDLAAANQSTGGLTVLLGQAGGAFSPQVVYGASLASLRPTGLAVADLDGDGSLDLAVAEYLGGLAILRGNGDGTFGEPIDFGDDRPSFVIAADLNGDGEPDLATTSFLRDYANVFLAGPAAVPVPAIRVESVTVEEGTGAATRAIFVVTLAAPSDLPVSVSFATAAGTAASGEDFSPASGALTFEPGTTSRSVAVAVAADSIFEADETFYLELAAPSNATLATARATATILNDDAPPTVSVDDVRVVEGDGGARDAAFVVRLSAPSQLPVTVRYATSGGEAVPGEDFLPASGTLTFAPGATIQRIAVPVIGDLSDEPDEVFFLDLSGPTNASLGKTRGEAAVIDDDDAEPAVPHVTEVSRFGYHAQPTWFVIGFSQALDVAAATDARNYRVTVPGRDGSFGTRDDRVVPVSSATYSRASGTVTLLFRRPLPLGERYRLVVSGGVADPIGRPLDGDRDGAPGGNYDVVLGRSTLRGPSTRAVRPNSPPARTAPLAKGPPVPEDRVHRGDGAATAGAALAAGLARRKSTR